LPHSGQQRIKDRLRRIGRVFPGLLDAVAANFREILYGAMLAALMYWRPQGLAGTTLIKS
jgi:ABC-type branched-subunit amino acid transport system permease subunit